MSGAGGEAGRGARSLRRYAVAVAAVLLHLALLALMLTRRLDPLFNDAMHRLGPGTDLDAYRVAGRAWRAGVGIYGRGPGFGFRYHPIFAATAGAALASVSHGTAVAIWTALHEVLLALDLAILRRRIADERRFAALAAILLFFSPYFLEVYLGNASFVVASVLLLAFELERRGRRVAWVAAFTASLLVKPLGLVFLPLLLLRRRFAEVGVAVGVAVVSAIPFFAAHPGNWGRAVSVNFSSDARPGWAIHAGAQGLYALFADLLVRAAGIPTDTLSSLAPLPAPARVALAALPLALGVVTVVATARVRDRTGLAVSLASAAYLLGYKDVWEHSYSFLVLGLGLLWVEDAIPRRPLALLGVGIALPTALLAYDVGFPRGPFDPEHDFGFGVAMLHHATKPFWVVVLYALCLREAMRPRPKEPLGGL